MAPKSAMLSATNVLERMFSHSIHKHSPGPAGINFGPARVIVNDKGIFFSRKQIEHVATQ